MINLNTKYTDLKDYFGNDIIHSNKTIHIYDINNTNLQDILDDIENNSTSLNDYIIVTANKLEEHTNNKSNPHGVTKKQVGLGNCDNTSDANKPISTATQTALNTITTLINTTKTNLENSITNHTNNKSNPHGVTKKQVGLGNCDNTSDANKPVSTAQKTAIDNSLASAKTYTDTKISELINSAPTTLDTLGEIATAMQENNTVVDALDTAIGTKVNKTDFDNHITNKSNPHSVTKKQVGLGNCDNTSDANKPISTATQTALDTKLDKSGGIVSGTLVLSKTQDLSGTSKNSPALVIGGTEDTAHMEIDANEIQAKTDGTTVEVLHINPDGGNVRFGRNQTSHVQVSGNIITDKNLQVAGNFSADGVLITGDIVAKKNLYLLGTLVLSKTQDLSGTSKNSPALVIGGTEDTAHMEIDANEIQAKADGTTISNLHINPDGGNVRFGRNAECNVEVSGNITAAKVYNAVWNADYAEGFDYEGEKPEIGDLVEITENRKLKKASISSRIVVGAVSDTYWVLAGCNEEKVKNGEKIAVGLVGQVYINIIGPVKAGDYIISYGDGIGISANDSYFSHDLFGKVVAIAMESNLDTKVKKVYCLLQHR